MQIITISSSTNRSGGTRQAIYQTQEFAARGYNATLCLPYDSSFWELSKNEQKIHWVSLPKDPSKHKAFIERLFCSEHSTIVHAFHNKAVKRIAWWGLAWGKKNIVCVAHRGVIYRPRNPLPYLSPAMKAVIINSKACANALRWHCPNKKMYLVPNGLPTYRIIPNLSKEEALKKTCLTSIPRILFGFIGNNKPQKGFDILLESFAKANIPGAHLLSMGVNQTYWSSLCTQLGILDRVHFLGHVEHVADYLQLCDSIVVPSRTMESSPNTLIEAMLMGIPTIATRTGGIPDIVQNNGILVPVADVQRTAEALLYMATHHEQRNFWGKQSLLLRNQYSITARCNTLEKIYLSLLKNFKEKMY